MWMWKHHICQKDYVWNPAICNCKNEKYLASIMGDSAITCDEIIESYDEDLDAKARSNNEAKSYDETNFDGNRATCKTQNSYIYLHFY